MAQNERVENLKIKLLNAAGKYSDYERYWGRLSEIEGEYDETLELYNMDIWWGSSDGTIREKAVHMLRVTEKLFWDMRENAEKELMSVVEEIMDCDQEEQKEIWGREIFLEKEKINLKDIKEQLVEWEDYPYSQGDALRCFVEIVEDVAKGNI